MLFIKIMLSADKAYVTHFKSQYEVLTFTILKADLSQANFVNREFWMPVGYFWTLVTKLTGFTLWLVMKAQTFI